jgi:hypothetical protein
VRILSYKVIKCNSHRIDSEQAGSRYNNHRAKRLTMTTFYNLKNFITFKLYKTTLNILFYIKPHIILALDHFTV